MKSQQYEVIGSVENPKSLSKHNVVALYMYCNAVSISVLTDDVPLFR